MSSRVRVILFNPFETLPLRRPFEEFENADVLGEATDIDQLIGWLDEATVDLVVVNLDAVENLDIVERIATMAPNCGVIGVASRTDPSTIIGAMRAGCSQFVPWPIDLDDLQSAIDRIRPIRSLAGKVTKLICVIGASGGVGATAVACNLASELGRQLGEQCALVDLQLEHGDVGCFFDCSPKFTVFDLCRDGVDIDSEMLQQGFHELPCHVSALVRPERPEQALQVTPEGISNMFAVARQIFPYIVVDLPRTPGYVGAVNMKPTDQSLIVTQLNVSGIRNATRIHRHLSQVGIPQESIGIVLNRWRADYASITPDTVETHFSKPPFAMIPNDYRSVQSSLDLGKPIRAVNPKSPAHQAIREMARRIRTGKTQAESAAPPRRGFLGRLRKRKALEHRET